MPVIRDSYNNNVTFGKKSHKRNIGKRGYTKEEKALRYEIKVAAIRLGWKDVYTDRCFTKTNPPTVEHLIPHTLRKVCSMGEGFQINGLDNLFPAGAIGNVQRGDERFAVTVLKQPAILDRLLTELSKYGKFKSQLIDGKDWAERLTTTMLRELEGIYSDLSTRKISFIKNL